MQADVPLVLDAAGRFYFKPEGGGVWASPHDETPDRAGDAQPEELDVAVAIDRFEKAGAWRVPRVVRAWAGLRSFPPDRAPVYCFDRAVPGVFWCAGRGDRKSVVYGKHLSVRVDLGGRCGLNKTIQ